jgi:PAS domain-containing protein
VKDYAIFLLDRAGYVMSWNAGAERIKRYTADEPLVGAAGLRLQLLCRPYGAGCREGYTEASQG